MSSSSEQAKYQIIVSIDTGGSAGPLWPGNEATIRKFGLGPYTNIITHLDDTVDEHCPLPLSAETVERCRKLDAWVAENSNKREPNWAPDYWRQADCNQFNSELEELIQDLKTELGSQFEVVDQQRRVSEDPDLDLYLQDPQACLQKFRARIAQTRGNN